ncbi:hypothetical protein QFC21_000703 [Naganishia friedmannii]|uniref:Uncharacterized protein n=1 Tax=Naganishia friedmannii TaxID=89922 RepID=A0ACC2WCA4_9TREE|nr:hypothetical protein QFC21_000703 [Naganishia friedmannii]
MPSTFSKIRVSDPSARKQFVTTIFNSNHLINKINGRQLNDVILPNLSTNDSPQSVAERDFCRMQGLALKSIAGYQGYRDLQSILDRKKTNVEALGEHKEASDKKAEEAQEAGVNAKSRQARQEKFDAVKETYEKGERATKPTFPKSSPTTIDMDSFTPREIERAGLEGGGEHKIAQSMPDVDDYLGYALLFTNVTSYLHVVLKMPWNKPAIKLAKVYPEVAQALKSAKARSRGTNAFSDSLDAAAIAVMTDLKKDPTDNKMIRGDAIVPNFPLVPGAQNPFFRPAMHYDHLVIPTMDDKLGNYVSSNMGVTSTGMAGLRWVHDSTIQKQVVRATANLHNNGQGSPDTPLAALTTATGQEMRQAWSAIKKLTVFERKVPYHLDKRYDTEITSPRVAQALNTNMEAVGSRDEHDTSAVDQILLSNYAGRIPVIKHVELENDRQRIIRLTEQFEEMYRFRLPRGVDGTSCPFLDNNMASWTILKKLTNENVSTPV